MDAIYIDDVESIELQLIKLKNLDYGEAVVDIENYLKKYKEVALYQDSQV